MTEPEPHSTPSFDPHDDIRLVQRFLADDADARDRLEERMRIVRKIIHAKNRRFGRPLDAAALEDVVQDTMVSILHKLDTYQGRGSFDAWAHRFCHNTYLWRARNHLQRRGESADGLEELAGENREALDPFLQQRIHEALTKVGPPGSDVLWSKHVDGLSFAEIARTNGVSTGTIKSQYYRAVDKIRLLLGADLRPKAPRDDLQ